MTEPKIVTVTRGRVWIKSAFDIIGIVLDEGDKDHRGAPELVALRLNKRNATLLHEALGRALAKQEE